MVAALKQFPLTSYESNKEGYELPALRVGIRNHESTLLLSANQSETTTTKRKTTF